MQFQVPAESEAEVAMVGNSKSPILMAQTWKGPENTGETQHWMYAHGANSGGQEGFSDSARTWDTKNRGSLSRSHRSIELKTLSVCQKTRSKRSKKSTPS